jgi:Protein prenyltransferase alpha subunit repeat
VSAVSWTSSAGHFTSDHRLLQEMRFAADCLALEPKNYHAWAHRQAVLLAAAGAAGGPQPAAAAANGAAAATRPPEGGMGGHSESRGDDDGCSDWWAAELEFVDACIAADARDNSAWAQRFFLLSNRWAACCGTRGGGHAVSCP